MYPIIMVTSFTRTTLIDHNNVGMNGIMRAFITSLLEAPSYGNKDIRAQMRQEARTEEKNVRTGNPTTLLHKPNNSVYASKLTNKLMAKIGA